MAEEIASLVVGIDSTSAVSARKHLDALTDAGARTEQSAKKAGRAWIDSIERVAASTSATSAKFDTLNGTQSKLLAVTERMAASLDAMSAAYARNGGQASATAQAAEKTAAALNKIDQGARTAGAGLEDVGKKATAAGKSVDGLESVVRRAAAAFSAWKIIDSADQWGQLASRLKVATASTAEFTEAQSRLMDISNRAYKSFSGSSELFIRTADSLKQLGYSSSQSLDQVEALTYGLVVSAADTQKSASVIDAWSKSIMLGKMEMDQFQTIVSNAPRLQKALADSLGVTNAGLLAMVSAGELTAEKMSRITSQIGILGAEADKMPVTVRDAMTRLDNSFTKWVGTVNESIGATRLFSSAIVLLSDNVGAAVSIVGTLVALKAATWFTSVVTAAGGAAAGIAAATTAVGGFLAAMGPVGWTVLALGGLATAWQLVGSAAKQSGVDQESAGQLAIAKANDLQGTINNLIEKYRQLGSAAKGALGYATQANQYNEQRANLNAQLQALEAQKESVRLQAESKRLAVAAGTGERKGLATGVITGGVPVDPTLTQMYGDKGAYANAVTDTIYLEAQIKAVRQSLVVLDQTKADADRKMAEAYIRSDESLTKEQQKIWATAEVWNKYYEALEKAPDQFARIEAARDEQLRKVEDKFKESAGPKGAATPLDYTAQLQAIQLAAKAESDILARAARDNEAAYQVGLKGAAQYYETKGELATQAAMVTVNSASAELEVVDRLIASGKGSAAEQRKLAAERTKLTAQVSTAVLAAFEAEANGAAELERYWLGFQKGWTEAAEGTAKTAEDQAQALRDQIDQYGMSKGAIADIVAARAREEEAMARTRLAMAIMQGKRQEEIALIEREVAALGRRADALAGTASDTYELERLEANDKFTEEAKRQNEQIGDSLTDALLRGFEDGQGFAENFGKTLKNMFATLVLKPIIQPIAQGAANVVTGALGLGGTGTTTSVGSSLLGSAGNLSSLIPGGGIGNAVASGASWLSGATGIGAIGNFGGGLGSGLAAFGNLTATMGNLEAGMVALQAGNIAGGLGSLIGTAAPYVGAALAVASILGIGKKTKPGVGTYGLADITSSGSVAASNEAMFFGDRRGYQGQSAGLTTGLATLGDQIMAAARLYGGDASGLRLYAQTAYSPDGKGASGGTALYGKGGQQVFGSAFEGTNEEMNANLQLSLQRALLAGLKESDLAPQFANVLNNAVNIGTATADELTQISAALEAVRTLHAAFDGMSATFPKLAQLGWESREALVAAAGGLDALTGNLNTYYNAFYSESERTANSWAQMTAAATELGVALPDTREGFRSLVEAQDLTTAAGQRTYASLIAMSGQFDAWATSAQAAANAVTTDPAKEALAAFETQLKNVQTAAQRASALLSTRNAAGSTLDSIDKALGGTAAFAAQREQQLWAAMQTASLEQQVDLAQQLTSLVLDRYQTEKANLESMLEIGKSLRTYVQGLKVSDLSPLTLGQKLAEAAEQYQATLGKARGGDQAALQALQGYAQTYLELQRRYSASGADYTAVFDSVTDALDGLGVTTQTTAEQQLQNGEESLEQLKELRGIAADAYASFDKQYLQAIAASKAEMAGLEKIALETGRLGEVTSLLAGLPAEIAAALQPMLSTSTQVQGWYQNNLGRDADAAGLDFWSKAAGNGATEQQFQSVAAREQALVAAYKKLLGRVPDAAGREFWLSSGLAADQFEKEIGKAAGIPGYARGGLTGTGLILVGEKGPELLDMPTPGRVYTNDQLSSAIRGGSSSNNTARLERLVEGLTAEVINLRAALVKATGESAEYVAATVAAGAEHVATTVEQSVNEGAFAASQRKVEIA